jgi:hypothetical protein
LAIQKEKKEEKDEMGKLIHGHSRNGSRSPEYQAYVDAKSRCTNKKHHDYALYGARGVRFEFRSFSDWFAILGPRPSPNHSVDRVDPDGPYAASYKGRTQVRWATRKEQANNRRNSVNTNRARAKVVEIRSEYFSSTLTQHYLASKYNVSPSTIGRLLAA